MNRIAILLVVSLLAAPVANAVASDLGDSDKGPWRDYSMIGFEPGMYGDTCLGKRTECLDLAHRLLTKCLRESNTTVDFFNCENNYDWDKFGCGLEYDLCLIGRLFG